MKTVFLIVCSFISLTSFAQQRDTIHSSSKNIVMENTGNDSLVIADVLDNYFKGIYEGDVALLGSTFNPGTLLFGDVKGQPYAKTLDQYLDGVKNRTSPRDSGQPFEGKILSVDVLSSIAIAKVLVKMYGLHYYDFLSFHKIDGQWLIVNKMITVNE